MPNSSHSHTADGDNNTFPANKHLTASWYKGILLLEPFLFSFFFITYQELDVPGIDAIDTHKRLGYTIAHLVDTVPTSTSPASYNTIRLID